MLLKIFTAKREIRDNGDTGTYADGYHAPEVALTSARDDDRASYERDYGRGRKVEQIPLGFA
ncbi:MULTISPECIES: hypothetical protein [unclassified Rhizobium]|uniref:hypothetical protein n=1 Tax=unclassified Rhizobium TaxID=2613769 RepID=UPI000271CB0A|nr:MULTISPECIES: hypothetical protein [unclassified Rhizobium]EJL53059.1 hypothetical protein PMI09_03370 [Rhizobium sp. CF122]MBB3393800.1 hypothetical protein [Rhizobium sp. BK060]MBB4169219.1 hypothetical protein [Rhizobium sp. BK538]TCM71989.1 hypothetical protein EV291_12291 [Rhizobium sp. BK068]